MLSEKWSNSELHFSTFRSLFDQDQLLSYFKMRFDMTFDDTLRDGSSFGKLTNSLY